MQGCFQWNIQTVSLNYYDNMNMMGSGFLIIDYIALNHGKYFYLNIQIINKKLLMTT